MHKECEHSQAGVLLENFWWRVILRSQFTLLLFRRDLESSILSFVRGLSFVVKRRLVKKRRAGIYCALQTFLWEKTSLEKTLIDFLLKCYSESQMYGIRIVS